MITGTFSGKKKNPQSEKLLRTSAVMRFRTDGSKQRFKKPSLGENHRWVNAGGNGKSTKTASDCWVILPF
jgi:hypothetical protein